MEQALRDALTRVLGHPVDARADTPLRSLGFETAAWPALAAVLGEGARLGDDDVRGVVTFGDLVDVVAARARVS